MVIASLGLASGIVFAAPTAVEYYYAGFGHYFVTASAPETAALDAGRFSGWTE